MTLPDHTDHPRAPALAVTGILARRSFAIRRSTALLGLTLLGLTTAWSGATTWYILRKDDLAARLISRETSRQYAYEDRIAALRADIDRLASRALLDQDGVEARVDEIAMRQAELESKQALVNAVTETLKANGIGVSQAVKSASGPRLIRPEASVRASGVSSYAPLGPAKPTPAPDMPALRGAEERNGDGWQSGELAEPVSPAKRVAEALAQLDQAMDKSGSAQLGLLRHIDRSLGETQKTLRSALSETGLDTDRLATGSSIAKGVGGPFVPIKIDPAAGPFEATLHSLQPRIAAVSRLRELASQLPLRRPIQGDFDMSSNFGYRVDPFTRGPAMHTGIDFRAETGSPIRATAPGKVVTAEYSGGYGNMVEVEHAGGISTRYAHMSAILVSVGQSVVPGTVVGRVGSTGRSTGPHLHYETRIEGDAIDPIRFLKAGDKLAGQL
ncbi:MAG: M23 family metallopeptidase [Bosea sp.]|uniref:M23 family metallopeptidase n=1 Tax=Bosea sp. (in: a-proteobacteria) TaxID=1871050 RepID=UPI001AD53EAF|nr:M23 family metallopeptidase [Bosea sp. (in: a-proteobacteria)]MBN9468167.1 M23 family metallopeptidase [Bosea sp. (in: a-proteobacteria)]